MTETAGSIISDALTELVVQASEADLEASEIQTGIRYLNRMMARWDAQGISLGYTKVSSTSSVMTVPDGCLDGIVKNLAVSMAKQFDAVITPDLYESAKDGLKACRQLAVNVTATPYPCTLPVGSGNYDDNAYSSHFYPCDEDQILSEANRNILLEDDT